MELNRHICTQLIEKSNSFSQITLDDDYIVRDNKPDVVRIIYSNGHILIEDVKAGNQGLWITGKLLFSTLYQSDDENHRLESVNGEIPFQEKLMMEDVDEGDDVIVDMEIEDLSIGIINSRKLSIRAVANVTARNIEEEDFALTSHIFEPGYEQKTKDYSVLCLTQNTKEQLRMQKEFLLPNSRSNIGQLIFYQVDFRNEEIQLQEDNVQLKLDAHIWILYRSESSGEYFSSSASMVSISSSGSRPSAAEISTTCKSKRQRSTWRRKAWPSPCPSDAPSIRPGISAARKPCPSPALTTPRFGESVVK